MRSSYAYNQSMLVGHRSQILGAMTSEATQFNQQYMGANSIHRPYVLHRGIEIRILPSAQTSQTSQPLRELFQPSSQES